MKHAVLIRRALLAMSIFCLYVGAPRSVHAQCQDVVTVTIDDVTSTAGNPFEAKAITTIVTYRSNGAKHTEVTKANLFRDSKGRVRVERFYDGTDDPPTNEPSDILIYDHCGGSVSLFPHTRTGKIEPLLRPGGSHQTMCQVPDPRALSNPGPAGRYEELGSRVISGVEAFGSRTINFKSIDAMRAGDPPTYIYEYWCSTTLNNTMKTYVLHDSPKREISFEISELKLDEPDPELFEIPGDYTMSKPEPSQVPSAEATVRR